ncbi:hypothetical protein GCM10009416_21130 [Craurococcus roseus]|uniref:DUF3800 domain-containing protein n=1 Tax=Craurococcus roseus TaxID=77585 RepID=A0ABN1F4Y2_9PROT
MKLIYIDEAGNTGGRADPDQPIHMIGALIVDQGQVRNIEERLNKLAQECTDSVEKTDVIVLPDDVEFHGAELYSGKKFFEKIDPALRIRICMDILQVCKEEGALFGAFGVDKLKKITGTYPHLLCFQFMLERVQDYLAGPTVSDFGLLVADEHRELEEQLIRDLAFSKSVNTGWGWRPTAIKNVVDTVHFVKSHHNRLIQACDVVTYFKLKGYRLRQRLISAYLASPPATRQFSFAEYCDANAKRAEKAVLRLHDVIKTFERFEKIWPL